MLNPLNTPQKDDSKNSLTPAKEDATLLLTTVTPKPAELLQYLEKNKVLIVDETPKTTVDSNFIRTTTESIEQQTNDQIKKRGLPDNVREHFEENSRAFIDFAQKTEKNANKKINEEQETNLWDNAIFFQEYPNGRKPLEIKNELSSLPFAIPKKQNSEGSSLFPTRIGTDTQKEKEQQTEKIVPFHPIITVLKNSEDMSKDAKNHEYSFSIPKKSETTSGAILPTQIATDVVEKNSSPKEAKNVVNNSVNFFVPTKPKETIREQIHLPRYEAKKNVTPQNIDTQKHPEGAEMSDDLKTKIIEGQLKNIFENAPEGTRATLEGMPAKMVFSTNTSAVDENEVWKIQLRDYVIKLKWQGKTVLDDTNTTNPKDNETVLDYIKRIYPAIVRAEVMENNKDRQ